MKIILLKNVENLGKIGDMVNVKNGYAKNFLFPKEKAILSTIVNLAKIKNNNLQLNKKTKEIEKLNNISIVIPTIIKTNGEIYGSINKFSLYNLFKNLDLKIDFKTIQKNIIIKKPGKYKIEFKNKQHNIITKIYIILIKINK